jgi:transcriptional regulator with XRE-family HTH domain
MIDHLGELKKIRKNKGLSLRHVADALRISESYLRAIEEKDYSKLPESVYAVGFIKNYASFLGISCEAAITQFKEKSDPTDNMLFDLTEEQANEAANCECECGNGAFKKYMERLSNLNLNFDELPHFSIVCVIAVVVVLVILIALL